MRALGIILFAPLGYILLAGYLFGRVRPVPITILEPFSFEPKLELDRVAA